MILLSWRRLSLIIFNHRNVVVAYVIISICLSYFPMPKINQMIKTYVYLLALTLGIAQTVLAQDSRTEYGPNILRVNPIGFVTPGAGSGDDPTSSFGLSYERILGKEEQFSIYLPVYIGIKRSNKTSFNNWMDDARITNYSVFVNPGIKFYPFGHRIRSYAVGPSLFAISGNDDYYFRSNGSGRRVDKQYRTAGVLLNHFITINITSKFNLGIELSSGLSLWNRNIHDGKTYNPGTTFVIALGIQAGYRF